jgi:tetratricopeptide (TPR) repeat protein
MRFDDRAEEVLREALELAERINSPQLTSVLNNLGIVLIDQGLPPAMELNGRAREAAMRRGQRAQVRFQEGLLIGYLWLRGDWQQSLERADEFIDECEAGSPHYQETTARGVRSGLRLGIGELEGALADAERGLALARDVGDPQALGPALGSMSRVLGELQQHERARAIALEAVAVARILPASPTVVETAWSAVATGVADELGAILEPLPPSLWRDGPLAVLEGDYERAARVYEEAGAHGIGAVARLHGAEAAGRDDPDYARRLVDPALSLFRREHATAYLQRAEALLAATA